MKINIQKNVEIKSTNDWFFCAPPKGKEKQWKDNYSAKELANFATSPEFETFISNLLSECGIKCNEFSCEPEAETKLPGDYRGPRNHDLLMIGKNVVIGIEAKVNEPYGNSVKQELTNCSKGKQKRIDWMRQLLFEDEDCNELKYQLLTGMSGTLIEAANRGIKNCIFLVLSFNVAGITSNEQNEEDFILFIKTLNLKNNVKSFSMTNKKEETISVTCHIVKKDVTIPVRYKF